MNIKGSYIIKQGEKVIVDGTNIITNIGESFFMNRAVNVEFAPLQYIVLGTSSIRAKKTDTGLGHETFRKRANIEINWNTKQILMYVSCNLAEILNTCEIGTSNGEVLISHDTYPKITVEDMGENIDSVEITYIFDFSTSCMRKGWLPYNTADLENGELNHIYFIVEESNIVRVYENINKTMQNGYRAVRNVDELKTMKGAYYYDPFDKILYVRTFYDEDPNNLNIMMTVE